MHTVAGVLASDLDLARALGLLRAGGFGESNLNVLCPHKSDPLATVGPEQPRVGRVLGGIVSGAAGTTWGGQLATAVAFIPGVGPVLALGLLAGVGVSGAVASHRIERTLRRGWPNDLDVCKAALRRGHPIIIVLAENSARADVARDLLRDAGAQPLDAADLGADRR